MPEQSELKENTSLINKYFPFNVFYNNTSGPEALYTHWHDNIEIIYMLDGSAVFYIGAEAYPAVPGDILFVNRGLLHSGYSINNTMTHFYAIVFHPSLLASQIPDPVHSRYISPFVLGETLFPVKVNSSNPGFTTIKKLIDDIIDEFERKDSAYEVAIKACLSLLIIQLTRNFPETQPVSSRKLLSDMKMEKYRKIISFVEDNYSKKITIEQASGIVSMSPFHFCKTFKKFFGRTFIEFLHMHRINRAEELLRSTDLSVGEVAEKVGFCNINYFDKLFKKYKHYSPSKCRRQE